MRDDRDIRGIITRTIESCVLGGRRETRWRAPLVGFAPADDPRFAELRTLVDARSDLPGDILAGARTVASFFLPFSEAVVRANAESGREVAREWAAAYVETNALLSEITRRLIAELARIGVRAAAEPPTGKFDRETLTSTWSHKSVAVIAGLGSMGVHRMLITGSGCAGRLASLVMDATVVVESSAPAERCRHRAGGACLECVARCPVGALGPDGSLDRKRCWAQCRRVATAFAEIGVAEVCGKCAVGPCALGPAA